MPDRLEPLLGARVMERRAASGGYTPARREVVRLDDGRSVFVKAAVNELTAGWLRKEHRLYAAGLDVAAWAPSLRLEGGPEPWSLLPDAGPEAALISGYFAAHCGLPPIPDAPRVRPFQLAQLRAALPWACRELGLPPPG